MLKLDGINKTYKSKKVFNKAHFVAKNGEITLLLGKSGSGKSTLLDIISGIKQFDSGNYYVNDTLIVSDDDDFMSNFRNREIGYILQDFALINDYSVLDNIILPSFYNDKYTRKEIEKKAKSFASEFGISEVLEKKVKHISGGQKQRVAIIRSLILNPNIILADEPTTNLDSENFTFIMEIFKKLKKENKIVIIATHDNRIMKIADKLYKINHYKIEEVPL
ncbi:MAG: ABC transporter ATP-binding protein [Enterococcus sp.]|nr:ABC transporter ATP-binding protein [Enterococcus sp.]